MPGQKRDERPYETVRSEPNKNSSAAKSLTSEGISHVQDCDWCAAESSFQAALRADISYGPAHNNLGRVYFAQKQYYLAAWEFEHAIKAMPERPEPYNNLGLVYEAVGRNQEAVEQYQAAHAINARDPQSIGNLARILLMQDPNDQAGLDLLRELVLYDTRPNWVYWARERMGLQSDDVMLASAVEPPAPNLARSVPPQPISDDEATILRLVDPQGENHNASNEPESSPRRLP